MDPLFTCIKSVKNSWLVAGILALLFVFVGLTAKSQTLENSASEELGTLEKSKGFSGEWKLNLGFWSVEEDKDDAKVSQAMLYLKPVYRFSKNFAFSGQFRVGGNSGREQFRYSEVGGEGFRARQAIAELNFGEEFKFTAGILDQDDLDNMVLISKYASFPGITQEFSKKWENWRFSLGTRQSIPDSTSSNLERNEKEALPTFLAESIGLSYLDRNTIFKSQLGHFAFKDLPAVVAAESELTGATVVGQQANAQFAFGNHEGYFINLELGQALTKNFRAIYKGNWVENVKAPATANRAQRNEIDLEFSFGEVKVSPGIVSYFVESDASPSYYLPLSTGGSNRQGQGYALEVAFEELGFKLDAEYYDIKSINSSTSQGDLKHMIVKVETLYVSF